MTPVLNLRQMVFNGIILSQCGSYAKNEEGITDSTFRILYDPFGNIGTYVVDILFLVCYVTYVETSIWITNEYKKPQMLLNQFKNQFHFLLNNQK